MADIIGWQLRPGPLASPVHPVPIPVRGDFACAHERRDGKPVYRAIAWRSFRRWSTYRTATAAGVFTNTIFGFILSYTYIALWHARPGVGGYDTRDALTYVWIGQSLGMVCWLFNANTELSERIKSGDIAVDLYRPSNLQAWYLSADLGRATFHLLARGIPPTVVASLFFDLRLPSDPVVWLSFLVSVGLAVTVSFALRFMASLSAFWLMDSRGVEFVMGFTAMFLSGMLLPLTVFPAGLSTVAQILPWAAILQVPADVVLGHDLGGHALTALGFQAGWALALLLAGRLLLAQATRKVVVQGG